MQEIIGTSAHLHYLFGPQSETVSIMLINICVALKLAILNRFKQIWSLKKRKGLDPIHYLNPFNISRFKLRL